MEGHRQSKGHETAGYSGETKFSIATAAVEARARGQVFEEP